jgi:hypothetical protein
VSSRTARATQRNPVSKNQKKKKKLPPPPTTTTKLKLETITTKTGFPLRIFFMETKMND